MVIRPNDFISEPKSIFFLYKASDPQGKFLVKFLNFWSALAQELSNKDRNMRFSPNDLSHQSPYRKTLKIRLGQSLWHTFWGRRKVIIALKRECFFLLQIHVFLSRWGNSSLWKNWSNISLEILFSPYLRN